ncbi:TPA: hypothetical protein MI484_11245 [Klebsiella pneumoniae]|nr:hypothetical protein DQW56_25215 [Klebsiella pneumoniae]HBY6650034.1 hypothetical protein [Klebsiella pneumoniae]
MWNYPGNGSFFFRSVFIVIATRKPLCNKRWSASPASQDLQLTQLRHPWVATKASCKSKKGWKSRG